MPNLKKANDDNAEADKWLSDMMFHNDSGSYAVCRVCRQNVQSNNDIYPICTNCNDIDLSNYGHSY
jgi:hypothetical protein